jgi:ribonuclease HI
MSDSWSKRVSDPANSNPLRADAGDYNTDTLYFYTDGSLKENGRQSGSWSVIGIEWNGKEWGEIFNASASHTRPACCNGQMELRAVIRAMQTIINDYPDAKVCIRMDDLGNQKKLAAYLASFQNQDQAQGAATRAELRDKEKRSDKAKDYNELYDLLDVIGQDNQGRRLNIQKVSREFDQWISRADASARATNPGFQ